MGQDPEAQKCSTAVNPAVNAAGLLRVQYVIIIICVRTYVSYLLVSERYSDIVVDQEYQSPKAQLVAGGHRNRRCLDRPPELLIILTVDQRHLQVASVQGQNGLHCRRGVIDRRHTALQLCYYCCCALVVRTSYGVSNICGATIGSCSSTIVFRPLVTQQPSLALMRLSQTVGSRSISHTLIGRGPSSQQRKWLEA